MPDLTRQKLVLFLCWPLLALTALATAWPAEPEPSSNPKPKTKMLAWSPDWPKDEKWRFGLDPAKGAVVITGYIGKGTRDSDDYFFIGNSMTFHDPALAQKLLKTVNDAPLLIERVTTFDNPLYVIVLDAQGMPLVAFRISDRLFQPYCVRKENKTWALKEQFLGELRNYRGLIGDLDPQLRELREKVYKRHHPNEKDDGPSRPLPPPGIR